MTAQEKLRLFKMAISQNVEDHALCLIILEQNIGKFTNNQLNCFGLLCSRNKFLAGMTVDNCITVVKIWASNIDTEWSKQFSGSGYLPYKQYLENSLKEELLITKEELNEQN